MSNPGIEEASGVLETAVMYRQKIYWERTLILGIVWDWANDELAYSVLSDVDPWSRDTKRQLISVTVKMYDPLGHLSPYITKAKVLFQKLWKKGLNWDDELPSDLQKEWQTWKCLIPFYGSTIKKVELHAFGDASETAYGAVVYVVVKKKYHSSISNVVMAKSRVAPLKKMTLPRLELMAAQMAAKLITFDRQIDLLDGQQDHFMLDKRHIKKMETLYPKPSREYSTVNGTVLMEALSN
ncbi:Pao retrotransposon peptidase family protein [Trichinella spiralis]|uniref:Pao retrotransposon peptidase family protein n=1 Tax=Trichinella spiralis TaxID=6334 RepID=UPI0001EFD59E|nr:Pao retrotransposon peptidase family protein [Trichinella spiralis]